MRGPVSLSCCVLYLAFSLIAGTAHVHRAADHHDDMRGLHVDHVHLGHEANHGPDGHRHPASPEPSGSRIKKLPVEHHDDDAIEFNVTAHRLSAPGLRVLPATVVNKVAVEAPSFVSLRGAESADFLRGPPGSGSIPARAPPA